MSTRKPYPSDVTDDEWAFVAPYLTLMTQDAPQRDYPLRETFNGLRWMARAGAPWRLIPNDLPRRWVVERSLGWSARFRRLARDYERLPETLAGLHFIVFALLMLVKAATLLKSA